MSPVFINSVTIDCLHPSELADFYVRLLGWDIILEEEDFVSLAAHDFPVRLGFQLNPDFVPPVWPERQGEQQQMVYLDFKAADQDHMLTLVQHAITCGARKADTQFSEFWTVMIDPEGHPFCIDIL